MNREEIKELAEHIYDLDAEVYIHLGSSLGRVFNRDRERCVNELTELLMTRPRPRGAERACPDRQYGQDPGGQGGAEALHVRI